MKIKTIKIKRNHFDYRGRYQLNNNLMCQALSLILKKILIENLKTGRQEF